MGQVFQGVPVFGTDIANLNAVLTNGDVTRGKLKDAYRISIRYV
jgi:hypothetical protein